VRAIEQKLTHYMIDRPRPKGENMTGIDPRDITHTFATPRLNKSNPAYCALAVGDTFATPGANYRIIKSGASFFELEAIRPATKSVVNTSFSERVEAIVMGRETEAIAEQGRKEFIDNLKRKTESR
jgi:hypothetical protein